MPVIEVHLIDGYDQDTKTRICTLLTDAIRIVVPAPAEAVTVMIQDHQPSGYMRGRSAKSPAPALPDPSLVVRRYLHAMEARDLDAAQACLGVGFTMTFPGTAPMTSLGDLINWARPRYQFVTKTYGGFDTAPTQSGVPVVYCRGVLSGKWPDGTAFDGIRFIDRFEVAEGLITRQEVWNDIAEVRP